MDDERRRDGARSDGQVRSCSPALFVLVVFGFDGRCAASRHLLELSAAGCTGWLPAELLLNGRAQFVADLPALTARSVRTPVE